MKTGKKSKQGLKGKRLIYLGVLAVVLISLIAYVSFKANDDITLIDYTLFTGLIMVIIYPIAT